VLTHKKYSNKMGDALFFSLWGIIVGGVVMGVYYEEITDKLSDLYYNKLKLK